MSFTVPEHVRPIRERVQQFRSARRVRGPYVVDGFDDAAAEQLRPDAVREVAGEERIAGIGHPVSEDGPAVAGRIRLRLIRTQRVREDGLAAARVLRRRVAGREDRLAAHADRREEREHPGIVALGPAVGRVVVALGAGDTDAEEDLRDAARRLAGLGRDPEEVPRRHVAQRPLRRHQLAGELVERLILRERFPDPAVVRIRCQD